MTSGNDDLRAKPRIPAGRSRPLLATALRILPLVIFALTMAVAEHLHRAEEKRSWTVVDSQITALSEDIRKQVLRSLDPYLSLLAGARGFLHFNADADRAALENYVQSLDLARSAPAITGVGFLVSADSQPHFFRTDRSPGIERGKAGAEQDAGAMQDLSAIAAAYASADPLSPAISPLMEQRTGESAAASERSFLLYLPLHKPTVLSSLPAAPPVPGVYVVLRPRLLLQHLFKGHDQFFRLDIFDGESIAKANTILSMGEPLVSTSTAPQATQAIQMPGRKWTAVVTAGPALAAGLKSSPTSAVPSPASMALALLLGLLTWVLVRRRESPPVAATDQADPCYREMFHENACTSVLIDPETATIIEANKAAAKFWKYDGSDLRGMPLSAFSLMEPERIRNVLQRFRTGEARRVESQHRLANGEVRDVAVYGAPVHCNGKTLIYLIANDITLRKTASAAQLQTVLEASPDAMLLVNKDGVITYANASAHKMFAYQGHEMAGLAVESLVPQHSRSSHRDVREHYFRSPRSRAMGANKHLMAVRRSGTEFPVQISLTPLDLEDKRVVIVAVQDISERVRDEELLRGLERRWKYALEGAGDGVWDWDLATGGLYCSSRFTDMLGYSAEEFEATYENWTGLIHPDDKAMVEATMTDYFFGRRAQFQAEARLRCKDGSLKWFLLRGMIVARDASGQPLRMIGTQSDISDRKTAEEALQLAAMVYQYSAEAMMITDSENNIVAINPAFTQLTGYSAEEVVGRNPRIMSSGLQDAAFYTAMWQTLKSTGSWQGQIRNRRKNGEVFVERLSINTIYDDKKNVRRYVALFSDITEKTRFDEMMWRQANFDSLTQLPNRRLCRDRLEQEIKKAKRSRRQVALLFIDLDQFKEVNDTFGHSMGDVLLQEVAGRISSCVRTTDTVARLGGDEFTIIMSDLAESARVQDVAQNIVDRLAAPVMINNEKLYTSVSIGITLFPDDASDADELIKNADQAMYEAKTTGRNRYCYFTRSMQEATQRRVLLTRAMHEAVKEERFDIYFQPIVDLSSGLIVKAEALLRWHHPIHGMVSPAEFIPIAETSGLILQISDWVFKQALQWARRWESSLGRNFQVGINVSPLLFYADTEMLQRWAEDAREAGVQANRFVLEITEGLLLKADQQVTNTLHALHEAGFQIALDDFGTGYSSLSYLKKFDIDYIKIDKSFIRDMENNESDQVLSEAIILIAHKLGLKVVAEGIESPVQMALLSEAGCGYGQGYLFARPMKADDLEAYVQDMNSAETA